MSSDCNYHINNMHMLHVHVHVHVHVTHLYAHTHSKINEVATNLNKFLPRGRAPPPTHLGHDLGNANVVTMGL